MNLFLSNYLNSVDKKGRASIPAAFRNILMKEDSEVIMYPSLKNRCIEVSSEKKIKKILDVIDKLKPFSKERDAFQSVIIGRSCYVNIDKEGRITLPSFVLKSIKITDCVCFVGKGEVFEIWNPDYFNEYLKECERLAKESMNLLNW